MPSYMPHMTRTVDMPRIRFRVSFSESPRFRIVKYITIYKCSICSEVFSRRWKLRFHQQLLHSDLICYVCSVMTDSTMTLEYHLFREHHIRPIGSYFCELCGARERFRGDLEDHYIENHEEAHEGVLET